MKRYVKKGQNLKRVILVTSNIVLHVIKEGEVDGKIVVLGNGNSLNVVNGQIVKHDPLMALPDVDYFDRKTTVFAVYSTFECSGLRAMAKELSEFINENLKNKEIILSGHSKSGICFYDASKNYINEEIKHTLITISPPFAGTVMASPEAFFELDKKFDLFLNCVYKFIFCNHNVDKDIQVNSEYLSSLMIGNGTLKSRHINVITQLQNTQNCSSFQDYCCYLLEYATHMEGDGIAPLKSQSIKYTEEYLMNYPHESSFKRAMKSLKENHIVEF